MSTLDDFSFGNFQRLEDFPTYTSIIRSFGRPIIPPLLTPQKRELFSQLRQLAILEKKDFKFTKGSRSCEDVQEANNIPCMRVNHSNVSSKFSNFSNSALSSSNLKSLNNYLPTNEMFVSTCKIPCSGVCSTVHDSVIVCPNETLKDSSENISIEPETADSNSETCESYSDNDCDCRTCQIQSAEVPYKNIGQADVSEDEQELIPEEIEFESLPTVIFNRKHPVSDTDTESVATYITQSTDLDKYMDYPFEFSSPDDVAVISQSQYSNFRSISSRSEDASTETIINTENELTHSASTLTGLNEHTDGSNTATHTPTARFGVADGRVSNRTYSVDSYMLASKSCDKKLYFRKSESEPLQTYTNKSQNSFISSLESDTFNQNFEKKAGSTYDISKVISDTTGKCNAELDSNFESNSDSELEPVVEGNIRRNSYTLLQPSPALIEAHADCCCQNNPIDASPHSCSSQHQTIPPNVAFKKEMVELVLPPVKDRDKMFPVLNCDKLLEKVHVSEKESEFNVINSEVDSDEEKSICKSLPESEINVCGKMKTSSQENLPSIEKDFSLTETSQKLKDCIEKPEKDFETSNSATLITLFKELKDSHQLQANKLMEEQNKQWLKLQEEFKDQERRLFEELRSKGIVLFSGNESLEDSAISFADIKSNVETSANNLHINKNVSDSYSSDSSSETLPTVIQNKVDKTLYNNDKPTSVSPTGKNCNVILGNETEAAYALYDACQEKEELTQTNICHSNSDISLQETVPKIVSYSPFTCPKQKVVDVKQCDSSVSFIQNDIESLESHQNSGRGDSFPFVTLTNTVLPLTSKQVNQTSTAEKGQLKNFNLNKEKNVPHNNSSQPTDQYQMSEMSQNVQIRDQHKSNELDIYDSNIDNSKTYVINDLKNLWSDVNINSDLSDINFNSNDRFCEEAVPSLQIEEMPQTTFAATNNPVKALKVSSSLTVLKRRISRDVNDPEFLKKLKRIPAMVKGYLTRRLLKTEKIEGMLQTMQESVKLLQNLSEEHKKGNPVSEQDEELQQKLLNQLITTYEEFYDIFFTISLKERLDLIAQSRNYRLKKIQATKLKNSFSINSNFQNVSNSSSRNSLQKNISNTPTRNFHSDTASSSSMNSTRSNVSKTSMSSDRPASLPVETEKHTSQHCTRRKRRTITDSRTYTKEEFKECQARACSNSSVKSDNKTPTRIYQSGTNMSRQIKSLVKPIQTKPWK